MKSAWEARVGLLLDPRHHPEFLYSFKPYDSPLYGGQPRIDWHAADMTGVYWMIEVKSLATGRRSINLDRDVTPGQHTALNAIAATSVGHPLLAVGQNRTLYIFDWRVIGSWGGRVRSTPLVPMSAAMLHLTWSPKFFKSYNLYAAVLMTPYPASTMTAGVGPLPSMMGPSSPTLAPPGTRAPNPIVGIPAIPMGSGFGLPSTLPAPSPSTSKPTSVRQRRRKLLGAIPSPDS